MGAGSSRSSSSAGGKARAGLFAGTPGSRREGKHLRGGPRPGLRAARSHLRSEAPLSKPESLFRSHGAPAGTQSSPPETPSRGSAQALCQLSQVEPSESPCSLPCSPPLPPYLLASWPPELPQPRHAAPAFFLGSDRVFFVKATSLPVQPEVGAGRAAPPRRVLAPPQPPGRAERGPRAAPRGAQRR